MHTEQLSVTLDALYAATLDPGRFPNALRYITDAFGGAFSGLIVQRHTDRTLPLAVVDPRTPSDVLSDYANYYASHDSLRAAAVRRITEVLTDQDIVTTRIAQSEVYNDFYLRHGMGRFVGYAWQPDHEHLASLVIYKDTKQSEFTPAARQALRHIVPHLHNIVEIGARVEALNITIDSLRESLDHFAAAVLLVNRAGRVVEANESARALLNRRDCLWQDSVTLVAACREETVALRQTIAATIAPDSGAYPRHVTITSTAGRPSLSVLTMPYHVAGAVMGAILVITDSTAFPPHLAGYLRLRFGFTETEVVVALDLARGYSPAVIAQQRRTSIHTVRAQTKQVLQKAGVKSKAELAALIWRDALVRVRSTPT